MFAIVKYGFEIFELFILIYYVTLYKKGYVKFLNKYICYLELLK